MACEYGTLSNKRALQIINQEGIGYAVQGYCSAEEFKDPQTVLLWQKAHDVLNELELYLGNNTFEGMKMARKEIEQ
jgi:hypothetical protein